MSKIDVYDTSSRPRLSPALPRTYDPNDPEVRERQRTMDVDMAMQLSRARRETISVSAGVSPYETSPVHSHTEPNFTSLSLSEQHDLDIARGDRPHPVDHDDVGDTLNMHARVPHLHQAHDPSLVVSLGPPSTHVDQDDTLASLSGLPTYQANVSRSNFDFSIMEMFGAEEKALLGISSPSEPFSGGGLRHRTAGDLSAGMEGVPSAGPSDISLTHSRGSRQRKISQSNPSPRLHRKGIGGKMALFEGNAGELPPTLPGRLMAVGGLGSTLSAVPSIDNMTGVISDHSRTATEIHPSAPTSRQGVSHAGHDRPYRFSFYSNALSATIHARSFSELPAEGQSFEDLFCGRQGVPEQVKTNSTKTHPPFVSSPVPIQGSENVKRAGTEGGNGHGHGKNNGDNFNRDTKNIAGDYPRNGAAVGGGGDFEGNTWWLDVQSPTDEEMKMLSKANNILCVTYHDTDVGYYIRFIRYFPYIHLRQKISKWKRPEKKSSCSVITIWSVSGVLTRINIAQHTWSR